MLRISNNKSNKNPEQCQHSWKSPESDTYLYSAISTTCRPSGSRRFTRYTSPYSKSEGTPRKSSSVRTALSASVDGRFRVRHPAALLEAETSWPGLKNSRTKPFALSSKTMVSSAVSSKHVRKPRIFSTEKVPHDIFTCWIGTGL